MHSTQNSTSLSLADLLRMLELQPGPAAANSRTSTWIGEPQTVPHDRVYGGLQLAQAIVAAGKTVPDEQALLTLQADFIGGVPTDRPLEWHVEEVAETATFSTRRSIIVGENGQPLFSAVTRWGLPRTDLPTYMPTRPLAILKAPEELPSLEESFGGDERVPLWWRMNRPINAHPGSPPPFLTSTEHSDTQSTMLYPTGTVPADPVIRAALAGYVTDMSILEPVFRSTGAVRHVPSSRALTLTHALTFHEVPMWDDWMQFDARIESLMHGRALTHGQLYDLAGRHLVSASQVGFVKLTPSTETGVEGN